MRYLDKLIRCRKGYCFAAVLVLAIGCMGVRSEAVWASLNPDGITLAYRIPDPLWVDDDAFQRLLAFLVAHRNVVDEVALFNEGIEKMGDPLTGLAGKVETLKKRIMQFHEAGIQRAGINVLSTIGHGMWQKDEQPPYQPMVGHDGTTGSPSGCINDPAFRKYTAEKYALMAKTNPDFIWVDDDFRMSHHGPVYPCFCPICLEKFGQGNNREQLVARLNAPENGELRQQWTEFCASSMETLAAEIGNAIRQVNPKIEVGLMTIGYSHSTYGSYAITRWMHALGAVLGRPGHGYYTDETPRDLLNKSMDVGRQIRDYPAVVYRREYELENFPYITLNKSVQTVINECTMALMMGCNGIAFNIFYENKDGSLTDYEPLFSSIEKERQIWERMVRKSAGETLRGFLPVDNPMLMANRKVGADGWFWEGKAYNIQQPNKLAETGLPLTVNPKTACGVLLSGKLAEAFTDEELRSMLSGAIYLDHEALQVLWDRGLGQYTGVRPGKQGRAVAEVFTDHPMNAGLIGDGRRVYPWTAGVPLIPISDKVQELAHLSTIGGSNAECSLSLFENDLGGRVAVSSYAAWNDMGRIGKRRQMIAVADWLAKGRLPVIIEEPVRVAPFVRIADDGKKFTLVLFNNSFDNTPPLTLRLRANPGAAWLVSLPENKPLTIQKQTNETILTVPSIPAWNTVTVIGE